MYKLKLVREFLEEPAPKFPANNPVAVQKYLRENCFPEKESWTESLWLLTLDTQARITSRTMLSTGGVDKVIIDPRVVVKYALDTMSPAVVIAHNHPVGSSRPSVADINQTAKLKKALDFFNITLLDHIIIARDDFYSFSEEKLTNYA